MARIGSAVGTPASTRLLHIGYSYLDGLFGGKANTARRIPASVCVMVRCGLIGRLADHIGGSADKLRQRTGVYYDGGFRCNEFGHVQHECFRNVRQRLAHLQSVADRPVRNGRSRGRVLNILARSESRFPCAPYCEKMTWAGASGRHSPSRSRDAAHETFVS